MIIENVHRATRTEACGTLMSSRKVFGSFVAGMKFNVSVCVRGKARRNEYSRSIKVLLHTTLTRRAVANSKPYVAIFCGRFAEAPRKGGPVFAGKWPRSMGSPMEPKPTQAAAKHYLT